MNRIPEVVKELEELGKHKLTIGIFGEEAEKPHGDSGITIGGIASVHEFGTTITGTGKKGDYTITIPERSFIRSGWDSKQSEIQDTVEMLLDAVIGGDLPAVQLYNSLGDQVQAYLQEYATALSSPPNAPATIRQKGSSNPLKDTGRMIDAISYEVE